MIGEQQNKFSTVWKIRKLYNDQRAKLEAGTDFIFCPEKRRDAHAHTRLIVASIVSMLAPLTFDTMLSRIS